MSSRENMIAMKKDELPKVIQKQVEGMKVLLVDVLQSLYEKNYKEKINEEYFKKAFDVISSEEGPFNNEITRKQDGTFEAMIQVTGHYKNNNKTDDEKAFRELMKETFKEATPMMKKQFDVELSIDDYKEHGMEGFDIYTTSDVAKGIWNHANKNKEVVKEAADNDVDKEDTSSKGVLYSLLNNMIEGMKDEKYKITQTFMNTISNIISKNFIDVWSSYRKFKVEVKEDSKALVHFITPKINRPFIARFINGREPINAFLHQSSEIKIIVSDSAFRTATSADNLLKFFKDAIEYYDGKVEKHADKLLSEVMLLDHQIKHLISDGCLHGIISLPLSMFFMFDEVDLSKDVFNVTEKELKGVTQFIKNITSRYKAPEKEQKSIIKDLKEIVDVVKESYDCEAFRSIDTNVELFYKGSYEDKMAEGTIAFIESSIDRTPMEKKVKVLYEFFGVKKLKKLPRDIVTYIEIEAENITSSNDKMMIASYCISKLEIVEWYISLIDSDSKKYLVPHNKQYLEWMRLALLNCYKKIMNTKVINPATRPIIDIQYPKGYEG